MENVTKSMETRKEDTTDLRGKCNLQDPLYTLKQRVTDRLEAVTSKLTLFPMMTVVVVA